MDATGLLKSDTCMHALSLSECYHRFVTFDLITLLSSFYHTPHPTPPDLPHHATLLHPDPTPLYTVTPQPTPPPPSFSPLSLLPPSHPPAATLHPHPRPLHAVTPPQPTRPPTLISTLLHPAHPPTLSTLTRHATLLTYSVAHLPKNKTPFCQ